MAFRKFKTLGEVQLALQLASRREATLPFALRANAPESLKKYIQFIQQSYPYKSSEQTIRETILFPIMMEIWKDFQHSLMLWSAHPVVADKTLGGVPDYTIAKRSALGIEVFETPLLAVVEAKKDDFSQGWAQCAAEMVAIQRINGMLQMPVWGIVTNGDVWEFGSLTGAELTLYTRQLVLNQLDDLYAALHGLFASCDANLTKHTK